MSISTSTTTVTTPAPFPLPARYHFPPMWTLQPTLSTRAAQFAWWSAFITGYCAHHRQWRLTLADALPTPLFTNAKLDRRLTRAEAAALLDWMASEAGGRRAEWTDAQRASAWVYWKRPEEWAEGIAKWVGAFLRPQWAATGAGVEVVADG